MNDLPINIKKLKADISAKLLDSELEFLDFWQKEIKALIIRKPLQNPLDLQSVMNNIDNIVGRMELRKKMIHNEKSELKKSW